MAMKDAILGELNHEMQTTRTLLERVPLDKADWKPHDKSTSLAGLATHVANIPRWAVIAMEGTELDVATTPRAEIQRTTADLLSFFDGHVSRARAAIEAATDEALRVPWTLKNGGNVMFTLPRIGVLRSFVMNHHIHHRGQLSVYLRLLDVPLPSIYGPTADM